MQLYTDIIKIKEIVMIDAKYKWDLSKFCKDQDDFEEQYKQISQLYPKLADFKTKLGDKKFLKEYLVLADKLSIMVSKLAKWPHLLTEIDATNTIQQNNMKRMENLFSAIGQTESYVMPELLSLSDEFFDSVIGDKQFLEWHHTFMVLKKQKVHVLTDEQEKLLSLLSPIMANFRKIFTACTYSDIQFDDVLDKDGKPHKLTKSNYSMLMENEDRVLRKNAHEHFYKQYTIHLNTLAANLIAQVQKNVTMAKLYKYDSALQKTLVGDDMDVDFYKNFVARVEPLFELNKEYNNLKVELIKKQHKLDNIAEYDLGLPVGQKCDKIEFDEGVKTVRKALGVLGEDYLKIYDSAIVDRWIDVYPDKYKYSGGFCSGTYGITPVILMNWENQLQDLYTLAHELGHAIRQVYCDANNPKEAEEAPMFIEETYSTVNQTLLYRYLIDNEKDKDKKIYYLCEYLDVMFSYCVGSVQDSLCEDEIYNRVMQDQPIDKDIVLQYSNKVYGRTQADNVQERHVPTRMLAMFHLYTIPYYVWQYAFGILNANMIVNRIQQNSKFVEEYLNFVKAGAMYPLDMLKIVDIDYNTDAPFEEMKKELNFRIAQLKELLK